MLNIDKKSKIKGPYLGLLPKNAKNIPDFTD